MFKLKELTDLTILPLLSTSEDSGINTVLLSANSAGIVPPSNTCLYALNRTCELNASTTTRVKAVRNSIKTRSRFLLCGHEFVKLAFVDYPADVVKSFLNVSQDVPIVVVPLTINARLKDCTPIFT